MPRINECRENNPIKEKGYIGYDTKKENWFFPKGFKRDMLYDPNKPVLFLTGRGFLIELSTGYKLA